MERRGQHSIGRRAFMAALASSVSRLDAARDDLLEQIERRACLYFYEQAHPVTGLVLDRVRADGRDDRRVASIAATGFGLSALCIAHQRGYLKRSVAENRAERTLDFFARRAFTQKGFYFHFLDCVSGARAFECELSSVDTAWLLCGVLHARQHFDTRAIRRLANEIIGRVDWRWMLAGGNTLSHGWTPENGFLPYRWDEYSELLAMYLVAMASQTYPIPPSSWDAWVRPNRVAERGGLFIESRAPLFVHQYSHAWFDFRNKQDGWADYFQNSKMATVRHREFCIALRERFPWFGEDMWGITASDSRYGYLDWGGIQTPSNARIDGTLVPCAAGGSVVFLPDECTLVLQTMIDRYGSGVWTRYGFVDAFQPEVGWYGPDVIGIDLGIMLLMAENLRTGTVWNTVMSAPEAMRGLKAAGFYDPTVL
ncbi:MAG TPA: glucoamylase family protein [Bryobacteraceae bacterium]|nr:glucoamylase family protein [Bryobacteraceae bacterium]